MGIAPADFSLSQPRLAEARPPRTTGHRPPDLGRPLLASSEGTGQPSAAAYTSWRRPCPGLPHEPGALCGQMTGRRSVPERQPLRAAASAPCAALAARPLLSPSRGTWHRGDLVPPPRPLTQLPPFSLHLWLPSGVLTENGQRNQNISKAIKKGWSQTQGTRRRPDSVHGQGPAPWCQAQRHTRGSCRQEQAHLGDTSPREGSSRRDPAQTRGQASASPSFTPDTPRTAGTGGS